MKLKVTNQLIEDSLKYHSKVMIGNHIPGCNKWRKPIKKNSVWGVISYGRLEPFAYAERVSFNGKEVYVKFYINYECNCVSVSKCKNLPDCKIR